MVGAGGKGVVGGLGGLLDVARRMSCITGQRLRYEAAREDICPVTAEREPV